jgi:hypothetical protein
MVLVMLLLMMMTLMGKVRLLEILLKLKAIPQYQHLMIRAMIKGNETEVE